MAARIDRHREYRQQAAQAPKLTISNLERHTTGKNQADSQRNVRRYLKTLREPENAKEETSLASTSPIKEGLSRDHTRRKPDEQNVPQPRVKENARKDVPPPSSSVPDGTKRKGPSLVASMKSRRDTDESSHVKNENGSSIQRSSKSPFLEPRVKVEQDENVKPAVEKKGSKRKNTSIPPPVDDMSSFSEDAVKKSKSKNKFDAKKRKIGPEAEAKPEAEDVEANSKSKGKDKARQVSDNAPRKKKKLVKEEPKTREDAEREELLEQRKERRRSKAVIVKDRTTVTAASKKASAAQKKADKEKEESSKRPTKSKSKSKSAPDPPSDSETLPNKKKRKRIKPDSEWSVSDRSSTYGEHEEGLDITTEGREKKKKRLNATEKGVVQVKDSTVKRGRKQDPLRRASNIAPTGRVTLKSGIYKHGQASIKTKIDSKPLSDLAFNEAPFLNQPSTSLPVSNAASPPREPFSKSKLPLFRQSEAQSLADSASDSEVRPKEPSPEIAYQPPKRLKSKIAPWLLDESTKPEAVKKDRSKDRATGERAADPPSDAGRRSKGKELNKEEARADKADPPKSTKTALRSPSPKKRSTPQQAHDRLPPASAKHPGPASSPVDGSATIDTNLRQIGASSDLEGLSVNSIARRKVELQTVEQSSPSRQSERQHKAPIRFADMAESVDHGHLTKAGKAYISSRPVSRRELQHRRDQEGIQEGQADIATRPAPVSSRLSPDSNDRRKAREGEDWLFSDDDSDIPVRQGNAFETGLEGLDGYDADSLQQGRQRSISTGIALSAIGSLLPFKQDDMPHANAAPRSPVEGQAFFENDAPPILPTFDLGFTSGATSPPIRSLDQIPDSTEDLPRQATLEDLECCEEEPYYNFSDGIEQTNYDENGSDLEALQRTIDFQELELANMGQQAWQRDYFEEGNHSTIDDEIQRLFSSPGNAPSLFARQEQNPFQANLSDGFHVSQAAALGLDVTGPSSSSPLKQQLAEFWRQNRA